MRSRTIIGKPPEHDHKGHGVQHRGPVFCEPSGFVGRRASNDNVRSFSCGGDRESPLRAGRGFFPR